MTNKIILTALLVMPFFVCAENQPQMMKTVLTQPTPKAVNFNAAVKHHRQDCIDHPDIIDVVTLGFYQIQIGDVHLIGTVQF